MDEMRQRKEKLSSEMKQIKIERKKMLLEKMSFWNSQNNHSYFQKK